MIKEILSSRQICAYFPEATDTRSNTASKHFISEDIIESEIREIESKLKYSENDTIL